MLSELILLHPSDHIMANTWRLIFKHKSTPPDAKTHKPTVDDSLAFEELLSEYRLIGLSLADAHAQRRYN